MTNIWNILLSNKLHRIVINDTDDYYYLYPGTNIPDAMAKKATYIRYARSVEVILLVQIDITPEDKIDTTWNTLFDKLSDIIKHNEDTLYNIIKEDMLDTKQRK